MEHRFLYKELRLFCNPQFRFIFYQKRQLVCYPQQRILFDQVKRIMEYRFLYQEQRFFNQEQWLFFIRQLIVGFRIIFYQYGIDSITPAALLKNFQRYRQRISPRKPRKYQKVTRI